MTNEYYYCIMSGVGVFISIYIYKELEYRRTTTKNDFKKKVKLRKR